MICPNCGAEMQEGDVFCSHCGYKVETKEEVKAPVEEVQKPVEDVQMPKVETFAHGEMANSAPYVDRRAQKRAAKQARAESRYCPNCGGRTGDGDVFCMRCGYSLQSNASSGGNQQPPLNVPVGDAGYGANGQPEIVCAMCGCKIPASSTVCPICQQPIARRANPRVQPVYQERPRSQKKPFNTFALIGFIFAMIGLLGGFTEGLGILFAIPGLVLGILGLVKSKKTGTGKGFAITAIILSGIAIAIFALMLMIDILDVFTYTSTGTDGTYYDSSYYDYWGNSGGF